jgi:hypothetical protein
MFHSNSYIILICVMCLWPGLVVDTVDECLQVKIKKKNLEELFVRLIRNLVKRETLYLKSVFNKILLILSDLSCKQVIANMKIALKMFYKMTNILNFYTFKGRYIKVITNLIDILIYFVVSNFFILYCILVWQININNNIIWY